MSYTHASIIPLIGGMTLASHEVFDAPPEYILTYEGFQANESHLLHYYKEKYDLDLPYIYVDRGERPKGSVDVISSVCPCAGLSQLSHGFGEHNQNNQWMLKTAEYVLSENRPRVFWGENAPGFAGKIGAPIRNQLIEIGRKNGYSMSIYRTKSLLHGTPQVRERSFYFFWRDSKKTPVLNYYNKPWIKIEDQIRSAKGNTLNDPINPKTPSKDDPYYRYILEEMFEGITHKTFSHEKAQTLKARSNDVFSYIEQNGRNYEQVGTWLTENGYTKEAEKCKYKYDKLASGKNIMRRGTIVPHDYIGAFVGHYPSSLTHPDYDRYITYREALTIMGLPQDFELLNPKQSANHICQNVPFQTAKDMATEVKAVLDGEREWVDTNLLFQYNQTRSHVFGETKNNDLMEFFN